MCSGFLLSNTSSLRIEKSKLFLKSAAIFRIAPYLKFPYNKLNIFSFLPLTFTDFVYNLVASNRYYIFGKTESCFMPSKELKDRFIY